MGETGSVLCTELKEILLICEIATHENFRNHISDQTELLTQSLFTHGNIISIKSLNLLKPSCQQYRLKIKCTTTLYSEVTWEKKVAKGIRKQKLTAQLGPEWDMTVSC